MTTPIATREEQYRAARVGLLYEQTPPGLLGAAACIVGIVVGLGGEVPIGVLRTWTVAAVIVHGARLLFHFQFKDRAPEPDESGGWERIFDIGLLMSGVVWGIGGLVLFTEGSFAHQAFLTLILGGMATGSVATYAIGRTGASLFYLPALIPLAGRFLSGREAFQFEAGLLLLIYLLVLSFISRITHRTVATSLWLKLENSDLLSEIQESEERYRSIVDSALGGIAIIDDGFKILFANDQISDLAGIPKEELLGADFRDILEEENRQTLTDRYLRRQAGEEVPSRYEIQLRSVGGKNRLVEISTATVRDPEGRTRTIAQIMDVSDRRRAEEAVLMASRMEATRTLAAGIAHDFNNLLVGVLGNAELMQMRPEIRTAGMEEIRRRIGLIQDAAGHAGDLARQLLTFARGGDYEPEQVHLGEVVTEAIGLQDSLRHPGISVRHDIPQELWPVVADRSQIGQVLLNLLLNAAESIPEKGTIRVRVRNTPPGGIPDADVPDGEYVLIEVQDDGAGMPEEVARQAFEPFFTTKAKGRGLGLAATHGIVTRHGGQVRVESKEGDGTLFRVYLPRSTGQERPEGIADRDVPTGSETVLVVDDDSGVLDVSQAYLENLGYRVLRAQGPGEGLRIAQAGEPEIHLAILNLRMPEMGGLELLPRLKRARPGIRVLFCSGSLEDLSVEGIETGEYQGMLSKPFTLGTMGKSVRQALDREAPAVSG